MLVKEDTSGYKWDSVGDKNFPTFEITHVLVYGYNLYITHTKSPCAACQNPISYFIHTSHLFQNELYVLSVVIIRVYVTLISVILRPEIAISRPLSWQNKEGPRSQEREICKNQKRSIMLIKEMQLPQTSFLSHKGSSPSLKIYARKSEREKADSAKGLLPDT